MIRLSKSQILLMHEQLIAQTGGSTGLRDEGMLVFLALNGIELQYTQTELSDIILQLAANTIQSSDLLNWILTHQI